MESRMERYAKYRDSIRRMSSEEFKTSTLTEEQHEKVQRAMTPEAAADFVHADLSRNHNKKYDINANYLRSKKRLYIAQAIVGLLLLAGFIVWGVLILGRMS
ncbi:MAG: hypothetical protein ACI32C_06135 [Candidatus Enteromonas sp.]